MIINISFKFVLTNVLPTHIIIYNFNVLMLNPSDSFLLLFHFIAFYRFTVLNKIAHYFASLSTLFAIHFTLINLILGVG